MELQLASHEIGRVEPQNHDNRLHLIVVDQPVDFIGEMEIFRLTAPGPGTYRIEHIVLLHERPEASSSKPRIENLSYRIYGRKSKGEYHAVFHLTTSSVCEVHIKYEELNYTGPREPRRDLTPTSAGRFHRIVIGDLFEDQEFDATITAKDSFGQSCSDSVRLSVVGSDYPEPEEFTIPVELINTGTGDLAGLPMRFGLPLIKGRLIEKSICFIELQGARYSASMSYIGSYWDDASLRWIMLEACVPAGIAPGGSLRATVRMNPLDEPSVTCMPLLPVAGWTETQLARFERIGRRGQPLDTPSAEEKPNLYLLKAEDRYHIKEHWRGRRHKLSMSDWRYDAVLSNGKPLSSRIAVKPRPSDRPHIQGLVCYIVDHEDDNGVAHLRSNMRLQFFPDQTFFKLHHRLEVISPALAPATTGGELPTRMRLPTCAPTSSAIAAKKARCSSCAPFRCISHLPTSSPCAMEAKTWQVGG